MHALAEELNRRLSELDRATVERVEKLVRETLDLAESRNGSPDAWPLGYFDQTAGALAGEPFERPGFLSPH